MIRYNSSSGGVIIELLSYLFTNKKITAALVTKMSDINPLISEPVIVHSPEELCDTIGSKYCPVPLNIELKKILSSPDAERYAVVGLPCHIRALRNAEVLIPRLKRKMIYHLGLMCSATQDFRGTECILRENGIQAGDVSKISYRGMGWPGGMSVILKDGVQRSIPLGKYHNAHFQAFTLERCLFCRDHTNELSDISFGDAWHLKRSGGDGLSQIITRTKFGDELMRNLVTDGLITLNQSEYADVSMAQGGLINKNELLRARRQIAGKLHRKLPYDDSVDNEHSMKNIISEMKNSVVRPLIRQWLISRK
jgi:coenzyme F420 hydrogenase subunit beta